MTSNRFIRQDDLISQEKLASLPCVTIVGLGAVGRPLALQLAAIGVRRLQLVDFDTIELHNVTTQGYSARDVGRQKVAAVADAIREIDTKVDALPVPAKYKYSPRDRLIFCAVDSIQTRAQIWNRCNEDVDFWADVRMLGETIRVLTAVEQHGAAEGDNSKLHYGGTLFAPEEVIPGRCTARSTIYAANLAASLAVHQFTRWLRGIPTERDMTLNLLASELMLA